MTARRVIPDHGYCAPSFCEAASSHLLSAEYRLAQPSKQALVA